MGSRVCVDTDILIDHLRGRPEGSNIFKKILYQVPSPCISVVTYFELWCGVRTPQEASIIKDCLAPFEILPFGPEEAEKAAEVYRELKVKGNLIGIKDILIAGTVVAHHMLLATRNKRDFARIGRIKFWA